MEYLNLGLLIAAIVLLIILLLRKGRSAQEVRSAVQQELAQALPKLVQEITDSVRDGSISSLSSLGQAFQTNLTLTGDRQREQLRAFEEKSLLVQNGMRVSADQLRGEVSGQLAQLRQSVSDQMRQLENRIRNLEQTNEVKLEQMRAAMAENMALLRTENGKKLDEIRQTVDEKLQTALEKRLAESFRTVSEQLEQVYRGLGEMQTLASDVGGLKRVLSGVKTRGILGEVQLGAILEEILSPEQYATNVATVSGSTERVEYAIRLPAGEGKTVYLPIDSKFPGDTYEQLLAAQETGERDKIEAAYKALESIIRSEAKEIRTKYVSVPDTTNFGIMFLPFEGLYAEVVNRGLIETLQREYQINIAGPSTMAALLNSLQMGFRTLAIQKRSNEVWEVLGAVKTEFEKFGSSLKNMQRHLSLTSADLETLIGTRSNAIHRKLRSVQQLEEEAAEALLYHGRQSSLPDPDPEEDG